MQRDEPSPIPAPTTLPAPSAVDPPPFEPVERALARVASRARALLITRRAGLLAAAILGALLAAILLDFLLRFPAGIRLFHLLALAAGAVFAFVVFILPALRFRPTPTAIALRVEKRRSELRGLLASGVEFARAPAAKPARAALERAPLERALEREVVGAAASRFSSAATSDLLRAGPAAKALLLALGALAVSIALALSAPSLARIGLTRALTPWAGAQWPSRTAVVDVTNLTVHPRGVAAPLRAALTRSARSPERTDVAARWRPVRDGDTGPSRRVLLTWQEREVQTTAPDGAAAPGALFERLIEADADAIEYRFETDDDQTPWRRIRLVEPPAVVEAHARLAPPAYAAAIAGAEGAAARPQSLEMGQGRDERAIAPPALLGSTIDLTLRLNKPVPAPAPGETDEWLAATLGAEALEAGVRFAEPAPDSAALDAITLRWTLHSSVRLRVALADEFGIESADEANFRFEAIEDRPPTATITEPVADRTVLPSAVIDVVGEGRDDVGLSFVWIEQQVFAPAGRDGGEKSGPGGALEPRAPAAELTRLAADGRTTAQATATLDLSTIEVQPGDEVWLTAIVADIFATHAEGRAPVVSTPRKLRIISEQDLVAEIRQELSDLRQAAIRLDDRQASLREQVRQSGVDQPARRAQAQISERVAREGETVERLQQRLRENNLDDERLGELLREASRSLRNAGEASSRAAQSLDAAADRAAQDAPPPGAEEDADPAPENAPEPEEDRPVGLDEQQQREIDDAQRDVQDRLAELIELLDAGQDSWVIRREIEDLVEQQRALEQQTAQTGERTAGRSAEELTERERSELEDIVQQQEALAERARELTRDLDQRQRELEQKDPTQAAALQQASRRLQQERVDQTMEQAAQQAQQNQTGEAQQSQQQAAAALEQALEDLEEGERNRDEVLRRIIASLVESLEALVNAQQNEIAALDDAVRNNAGLNGLDAAMIQLNTNTIAVLDLASGAGRELAPVAALVERASESQSRAIVSLRRAGGAMGEAAEAREHEARSLDFLIQARDEAKKLGEQMQQQEEARKKAELMKAYREALELQVVLRADTAPFAEVAELSRRDRFELRSAAQRQESVREMLSAILRETAELSDAAVFEFAHRRLDVLTGAGAEHLRAGEPAAAIRRQDAAVAILQGILESLREEAPPQDDEFAQGGGAGEGQPAGGQEQLIPPIAELRLLRQIQADLLVRTRTADEFPGQPGVDGVHDLGDEQRELGELGELIIERMNQQQPQQPENPLEGGAREGADDDGTPQ